MVVLEGKELRNSKNLVKRATLMDVAREANVSVMAVSKVINGGGPNTRVSPGTVERIVTAANKLSYRPNPIAQQLRKQGEV